MPAVLFDSRRHVDLFGGSSSSQLTPLKFRLYKQRMIHFEELDGRIPPARFAPSRFCKENFEKNESVSQKGTPAIIFSYFSSFQFLLVFAEEPMTRVEK